MSELQNLNLNDLIHRYREHTHAAEAVDLLKTKRGDESYLKHLLRHHGTLPVEDRGEIYLRDAIDELLAFYSILEIASLVCLVNDDLPPEFRVNALADLSEPAVKTFYERHYPLVLPKLFRKRLEGINNLHERGLANCRQLFMELLDLNEIIERDKYVKRFLMFLDDFEIDGYSRTDLLTVLEDPRAFIEHIRTTPEEQTSLDQALLGCCSFLKFTGEFNGLLRRSRQHSVFQSAAWHYHAYWFGHAELSGMMHETISRLSKWGSSALVDTENLRDTDRAIRALRSAINDLVSGKYGIALKQLLGQLG